MEKANTSRVKKERRREGQHAQLAAAEALPFPFAGADAGSGLFAFFAGVFAGDFPFAPANDFVAIFFATNLPAGWTTDFVGDAMIE